MSKQEASRTSNLQPKLVSRDTAANFLSVSPRLFDDLVRRGEIAAVRVPGVRRVAFDVGELTDLVEKWKAQR